MWVVPQIAPFVHVVRQCFESGFLSALALRIRCLPSPTNFSIRSSSHVRTEGRNSPQRVTDELPGLVTSPKAPRDILATPKIHVEEALPVMQDYNYQTPESELDRTMSSVENSITSGPRRSARIENRHRIRAIRSGQSAVAPVNPDDLQTPTPPLPAQERKLKFRR